MFIKSVHIEKLPEGVYLATGCYEFRLHTRESERSLKRGDTPFLGNRGRYGTLDEILQEAGYEFKLAS